MSTESAQNLPSIMSRLAHFAGSLTAHVQDGLRKCTHEEIQQRLEVCESCSSFQNHHCVECGCGCSRDLTFFNKLAWQSERCPLNRWPSIRS